MDKPTEYEFVLPDGSRRYEFVNDNSEIHVFTRMHGATSAAPVARRSNFKRRYLLGQFTVERTEKGWQFCPQGHEKQKGAWSKPYSSIASVTLMVARQLRKEVERRDATYNID